MRVMFTDSEEGFITSRLNNIICCAIFNQNEKQTSSM